MKYIIEIPDEVKWIQYIQQTHNAQNLIVESVCDLTPYTEPDRKAIEDAQEEAWKMASKCLWSITNSQSRVIFGMNGVYVPRDLSYQDAKAKYDEWSKQNIRVGDEVIYNSRTKAVVLIPETKEKYGTILTDDFATIVVSHDDLEKTGRHFDDIAELLKEMREEP